MLLWNLSKSIKIQFQIIPNPSKAFQKRAKVDQFYVSDSLRSRSSHGKGCREAAETSCTSISVRFACIWAPGGV